MNPSNQSIAKLFQADAAAVPNRPRSTASDLLRLRFALLSALGARAVSPTAPL